MGSPADATMLETNITNALCRLEAMPKKKTVWHGSPLPGNWYHAAEFGCSCRSIVTSLCCPLQLASRLICHGQPRTHDWSRLAYFARCDLIQHLLMLFPIFFERNKHSYFLICFGRDHLELPKGFTRKDSQVFACCSVLEKDGISRSHLYN